MFLLIISSKFSIYPFTLNSLTISSLTEIKSISEFPDKSNVEISACLLFASAGQGIIFIFIFNFLDTSLI